MNNQGGSLSLILKQIKEAMDRHLSSFGFAKTSAEMISDIQKKFKQ